MSCGEPSVAVSGRFERHARHGSPQGESDRLQRVETARNASPVGDVTTETTLGTMGTPSYSAASAARGNAPDARRRADAAFVSALRTKSAICGAISDRKRLPLNTP